ncbi:MAG: cytosine permease, partial [Spirochaetales bacterium]|nr:cytosine permease [Spirochaetales bacterium]
MAKENAKVDVDYAESAVPSSARRSFLTMFMIMLGFTFFSASMWVGQQLADGLDLGGFIGALIFGGAILAVYTGLLGYVGAKTGMSLDLLSRKAFGKRGSYLPSAMIAFTQIGWFGVGVAMFAIPVANELLGGSVAAEWILVIVAGICMTASAYFGIKSLTIVSYIAVPCVAILGTVAMIMAVARGDSTLVDQFAKSSGSLTVIGGAGLVVGSFVSGGTATPNFTRFARNGKAGVITTVIAFFIGNSLMFFFGGISSIYVGGNDIFEVMLN